jgi:quercetin dioxygenase-like cupin family protein
VKIKDVTAVLRKKLGRGLPALALLGLAGTLIAASSARSRNGGQVRDGHEAVRVDQLLRSAATTSGHPLEMPEGPVEVAFSRYRIPPRASLPVHKHVFPRYGYVMEGSLMVTNAETKRSRVFVKGEAIVEDVDTWHAARNLTGEPVELLVVDVVKQGAENVVVR